MKGKYSNNGRASPRKRVILLAVMGISPGILTETVWALSRENPPVIPDEVIVIATLTGSRALSRELLEEPEAGVPCIWKQLRTAILGRKAAGDDRLQLTGTKVIEARSKNGIGKPLEDLRTQSENDAAADFILEEVRRITANDDTELIASIAGGRKTMGALLYAAVSLLGRNQDRLTHVLVSEPFDNPALKPKFYFPEQWQRPTLFTTNEKPKILDVKAARIELGEVMFPRLRYLFRDKFGRLAGRFSDLVAMATERVAEISKPLEIHWDTKHWVAIIEDTRVELTGRDIPFFHFLWERSCNGLSPFNSQKEAIEPFVEFLNTWCKKHPDVCLEFGGSDWRKRAPEFDDLKRRLSSLRSRFKGYGLGYLIPQLFPLRGPLGFRMN